MKNILAVKFTSGEEIKNRRAWNENRDVDFPCWPRQFNARDIRT